jgi:hypothetical protein
MKTLNIRSTCSCDRNTLSSTFIFVLQHRQLGTLFINSIQCSDFPNGSTQLVASFILPVVFVLQVAFIFVLSFFVFCFLLFFFGICTAPLFKYIFRQPWQILEYHFSKRYWYHYWALGTKIDNSCTLKCWGFFLVVFFYQIWILISSVYDELFIAVYE